MRSKVMYSVLFFAAFVIAIAALFGTVTIGDQIRVIKDFGLFSISVFTVGYAIIVGAALLHKELSRKTVYNILAKPVHRSEFILGKFLGMLFTSVVMVVVMGAGLMVFVWLFSGVPDWLLPQAFYFIFLELVVVCAASIFFSSIVVTPLLAGLFTLGVFLAGRSAEYLLHLADKMELTGAIKSLLHAVYWVLPHLHQLSIANSIVYGERLSLQHAIWYSTYAAGYAGVLLCLASILFRRREFN